MLRFVLSVIMRLFKIIEEANMDEAHSFSIQIGSTNPILNKLEHQITLFTNWLFNPALWKFNHPPLYFFKIILLCTNWLTQTRPIKISQLNPAL